MEKQKTTWDIVKDCERYSHNEPIIVTTPEEWEKVKNRFTEEERKAVADVFKEYGGAKNYFENGGEVMNFEGWVELISETIPKDAGNWVNYIDFASMLHDEYLSGWVEICEGVIIKLV